MKSYRRNSFNIGASGPLQVLADWDYIKSKRNVFLHPFIYNRIKLTQSFYEEKDFPNWELGPHSQEV